MKKVYPTIFTQADDVVLIEVPDMGILTEGKDIADAVEMARDAIGLKGISLEDDKLEVPEPSEIADIDIQKGTFAEDGKSFVSLVDVDFLAYRSRLDNKTVRRNVTLPNWLNREAEEAHLNVSRVLQEALMSKLGVTKSKYL